MAISLVHRNYHRDSETAINHQLELFTFYGYLSMLYNFDLDDVALKNFAKYIPLQFCDARALTEKLEKLDIIQDIKKPSHEEWAKCALLFGKIVDPSQLERAQNAHWQ